jgi:hypothetical protein
LFDALNALGLGLQFSGVKTPLNNVDLGQSGIYTTNQGNSVSVQFNLKDNLGTEITDANQAAYQISNITLKVAEVEGTERPLGTDYFSPQTSNPSDSVDFFSWDGSKWGFQFGTKNLEKGKTYAARIYINFDPEGQIIPDVGQDQITFLFKLV